MEELNYKAAYLYLVGAVDDVICQLEQPDGQGNTFAALTALRQALTTAEAHAIDEPRP